MNNLTLPTPDGIEDGLLYWDLDVKCLSSYSKLDEVMIAGGSILALAQSSFIYAKLASFPHHIKDFDCYFRDEAELDRFLSNIGYSTYFDRLKNTQYFTNAIPLTYENLTLDIIYNRFCPNMKTVFESFDFTAVQWGYQNGRVYATPEALKDTITGTLTLANTELEPEQALASLFRTRKMEQKGFTVTAGLLCDLADRLVGIVYENEYDVTQKPDRIIKVNRSTSR